MAEYILSVGNCGYDNSQLTRLLAGAGDLAIRTADSIDEAEQAVDPQCRLVLANRVFDRTGESGVTLIERLAKSHPDMPLMLISNYADAQQSAAAAGALPGFGKSQMGDPQLTQRLATLLTEQKETEA